MSAPGSAHGRSFHSRHSSEILPDHPVFHRPKSSSARSALSERSQSQINKNNGEHPTIRLVSSDSNPSSPSYEKPPPVPKLPPQLLNPPQRTTKHGYTVQNDGAAPNLEPRIQNRNQSPKRSSKLFPHLNLKKSNRFSSSTTTSNAETLLNDSLYSPTSNRFSTEGLLRLTPTNHRFSTEGTLRNTPTPGLQEREEREREAIEALEASVQHTQQGPSTIRPVTASTGSSASSERPPNVLNAPQTPNLSAHPAFETPTHQSSNSLIHPAFRRVGPSLSRRNRLSDIESVGTPGSAEQAGSSQMEPSSEYSQHPSSPTPASTRLSSYNIVRHATSEDSIDVQFAQVRPPTAHSQSVDSWTATDSDSLPPLEVARKRRHMPTASTNIPLDLDSAVSPIHSDSESSNGAFLRNRFSYGSEDILRSPSASSQTQRRRANTVGSPSLDSRSSMGNYGLAISGDEDSQMDLTGFSMMRAESAVPVPLFSSSIPNMPVYELPGDMPPGDTTMEEQDDTIGELQHPTLRTKHSGYGLSRRRSTSDPPPGSSRSNQTGTETTNRSSDGSLIFPQWAKSFYRGRTHLGSANASRTSLARPDSQSLSTRSPVRMMPWAHHRRFESGWESYATGDTGFTSTPPATGHSGATAFGQSAAGSSHFLPSIFRPNNRRQIYSDITVDSSHISDEFYQESTNGRPDSLEITSAPPQSRGPYAVRQPSPLGYSNSGGLRGMWQRHNLSRDSTFMSSQRGTLTPPHLAPSRRLSHRISAWRAPSFDETLSSLFKTRQNRQILLFCLGFLCPVLWMVAAFLPIPPRPNVNEIIGESVTGDIEPKTERTKFTIDAQAERFDWEQERKYLKARWWRTLNRVMSIVGVGVIIAIIVLAVVASQ